MASTLRKINAWMHKILMTIAGISLLVMVAIVTTTVFLRYVLNHGNAIAEEVPKLLVTLLALIAMSMGVRDHLHISADILYARFPKGGIARKGLDIFSDCVVLICGLVMLISGTQRVLTQMQLSGALPMTGLPAWIQYIPVPLAGFMITFDSILFLTGILKRDDRIFDDGDATEEEIIEAAREEMKQRNTEVTDQ